MITCAASVSNRSMCSCSSCFFNRNHSKNAQFHKVYLKTEELQEQANEDSLGS